MKATSALWPRMATEMTWSPSAWARLTAETTASASTSGVGLQKRWSTPQPTAGETAEVAGSVTPGVYGRLHGQPDSATVASTPVPSTCTGGDPHATPRRRPARCALLDRPDDLGQGCQPVVLRRPLRLDLRGRRRGLRALRDLLP